MALPLILQGAGLAASVLGGLFSGNDAEEYMEKAMAQYAGIVPPDLAREIVYTQLQQGGQLTPQQLSKLPEEAQQVALLQESPEMRQKQMVQLQALEQLASTGMGAQERFALEQSRLKAAQDAQARLKGVMQQYQQMGRAGGPAEMMAQAQALQQTEQNEYMANLQAASMAAENRRAAIQAALTGAGGVRQQDLGVEQANVEAMRQRQLFDIQNARSRQLESAKMAQEANMLNLRRQQAIMDANIQQQNEELYRRMYLAPQQMFANQMRLAEGRAGVYGDRAAFEQGQAQRRAQNWANIGGAIGGIGGALGEMEKANQFQDALASFQARQAMPGAASQVYKPQSSYFQSPYFNPKLYK